MGLLERMEESRWSLAIASELSHAFVYCLSSALAEEWRDFAAWISPGWGEGDLQANRSCWAQSRALRWAAFTSGWQEGRVDLAWPSLMDLQVA